MIPDESRFESDPHELLPELPGLPEGWSVVPPDPADRFDVAALTRLLRDHERHGRGWPGAGVDDVLVEVSETGLRMRENVVVRDPEGEIRAWGSVHDRAGGRMLLVHVVDRSLEGRLADACSQVLLTWAEGQARAVGAARGLEVQQIDTGAFEGDERQARWLAADGFSRVRRWWQMTRPVQSAEVDLVADPADWTGRGVRFRLVRRGPDGLPDADDLRAVHAVLEEAFRDHFNGREESFEEFEHRLREDPGHRWDHWWIAELLEGEAEVDGEGGDEPLPVGALVGTVSEGGTGPDGSYVAYIGVRAAARGRGVAKGLLATVVADAAARGRDRVTLEVDADSSTGADALYTSLGWRTSYVTESWHRHVAVTEPTPAVTG